MLFTAKLYVHIFLRYTTMLLTMKITLRRYVIFFMRLLTFMKCFAHNKFVSINGEVKIQLYVPAYPSPAFFHAIEKKFLETDEPGPLTVVFSMTKACTYKCPHCYQRHDTGKDLHIDRLIETAREMQDIGVSMMDIEGGEPLIQFDRLYSLLKNIDHRTEKWVNTTGHSLSRRTAELMKEAGVFGVMISLHSPDPSEYEEFTGIPGSFQVALDAMRMFRETGITTAINCCMSPERLEGGALDRIMDIARNEGCSFIQVIHEKSAGAWIEKASDIQENFMTRLREYHVNYNTNPALASYPSLSVQVFEESRELFGCTAGGIDRFYLNAHGEVQPCEFLNVSFGNVSINGFGPVFRRMRNSFSRPGVNWLCCTEAKSIEANAMDEKGHRRFPVPRKITENIVSKWNKGDSTPLYDDLGLYPGPGQ